MADAAASRYAVTLSPAEFGARGEAWLVELKRMSVVVGGGGRRAIIEATPSALAQLKQVFADTLTVEPLLTRTTRL